MCKHERQHDVREEDSISHPEVCRFLRPTSRYVQVQRTELSLKTDWLLSLGVVAHSKLQCQWTDRQQPTAVRWTHKHRQTQQNQLSFYHFCNKRIKSTHTAFCFCCFKTIRDNTHCSTNTQTSSLVYESLNESVTTGITQQLASQQLTMAPL